MCLSSLLIRRVGYRLQLMTLINDRVNYINLRSYIISHLISIPFYIQLVVNIYFGYIFHCCFLFITLTFIYSYSFCAWVNVFRFSGFRLFQHRRSVSVNRSNVGCVCQIGRSVQCRGFCIQSRSPDNLACQRTYSPRPRNS